jgi:hypothetical protein
MFITVVEGQVTFYERDDPTALRSVVRAGEGYVDTGQGHIGPNETVQPAKRRDRHHRASGRFIPRRARRALTRLRLLTEHKRTHDAEEPAIDSSSACCRHDLVNTKG